MAITMMVLEEQRGEPGTFEVNNYNGAEKGRVSHHKDCLHANKYDLSGEFSPECKTSGIGQCWIHQGLVMKTTHVGKVVFVGEHNWRDDSDFYALVWDDTEQKTVEIEYGTTRAWTYPNHAEVDATPEVVAAYSEWRRKMADAARAREIAREAATPRVGKTLRVVKGRKVPIGTEGECIWTGSGTYGPRVGLKDALGNTHWTATSNVEVV